MRHFKRTRLLGQALRLAQLIRGMDVIDIDRASALAAGQLRIDPMVFEAVVEALQEAALIDVRGDRIYEHVQLIDFAENYERIGDLWVAKKPHGREEMAVGALDELVDGPKHVGEIDAVSGTKPTDLDTVLQIAKNAHLVEPIDMGRGDPVLFAPMLWDVDPARFGAVLKQLKDASIGQVVQAILRSRLVLNLTGCRSMISAQTGKQGDHCRAPPDISSQFNQRGTFVYVHAIQRNVDQGRDGTRTAQSGPGHRRGCPVR